MRGKIKNIVSVIAILLMANSLIHIGSKDINNKIDIIGAYIICCVVVAIVLGLAKWLLMKVKESGRYYKKTIVGGTLALAIVISYIAPLNYMACKSAPVQMNIEAMGEKNEASQGTEVWIKSIQVDDRLIDLQSLAQEGGWEFKNGKLVSYENQPQQLSEMLEYMDSIKIELIEHPYSGKAVISINDEVEEVDLYNSVESTKLIEEKAEQIPIVSVTVIVYIGWFILELLLSMIICLLILLLGKNGDKGNKNINILIVCTSLLTVSFFSGLSSFILIALISLVLSFILINLNNRIEKEKSKLDVTIILGISVCMVIMSGMLPTTIAKENVDIHITATGESNKLGLGSEVWISDIIVDGKKVNLSGIELNGGWEDRGRLVSYENQPAMINHKFEVAEECEVIFLTHPYSGYVMVGPADEEEKLDLYSAEEKTISYKYKTGNKLSILEYVIAYISFLFTCIIITRNIVLRLLRYSAQKKSKKMSKDKKIKSYLLYSGSCILIWLVYWLSYYPALMSADSIEQWKQAKGMTVLLDGHPVVYTLLIRLLASIWDSPAAVALFQIIVMASIVGVTFVYFENRGIKKGVLIVIATLFAILPSNAMMIMCIWKDIPYNLTLIILTFLLMKVVLQDGIILKNKTFISIASIVMAATILFRHNGMVAIILTIIMLFVVYKKYWKSTAVIALSTMIIVSIVKGPIYDYLQVDRFENSIVYPPMHQISAVINKGGKISTEDLERLDKIMPLELWKDNYNPYYHDFLVFPVYKNEYGQDVNLFSEGPRNKDTIMDIWKNMLPNNLGIVTKHQLDLTSIVWKVNEPKGSFTLTTQYNIEANNIGLEIKPVFKKLNRVLTNITKYTESNNLLYNMLWRPALPFLISIIFMAVLWRKIGYKVLLMYMALLGNVVSLMLAIPAQCYRYLYCNYFIAILLGLLMITIKNETLDIKGGENGE